MKEPNIWELEAQYLAEQWQPLFVNEVMAHFHKRMKALRSPKAAFAEVYEVFFLNPSAEGAHQ
jgi:hypothetical protein